MADMLTMLAPSVENGRSSKRQVARRHNEHLNSPNGGLNPSRVPPTQGSHSHWPQQPLESIVLRAADEYGSFGNKQSLPRRPSQCVPTQGFESAILSVVGKGGGEPLDGRIRLEMEGLLGADFSSVRVHKDHAAARSAKAISAKAYTVGNEVVFGSEMFAPETQQGRHLLAHELEHVRQQQNGPERHIAMDSGVLISDPSDLVEREAEAAAIEAVDRFNRGTESKTADRNGVEASPLSHPSGRRTTVYRQSSTATAATGTTSAPAPAPTNSATPKGPSNDPPLLPGDVIKVEDHTYVIYADEVRNWGDPPVATSSWIARNPGNIMNGDGVGAFPGKHVRAVAGDGTVVQPAIFPTEEIGLRAIRRVVEAYGKISLLEAIRKYAPQGHGENDPDAYARKVAEKMGIPTSTLMSNLTGDQWDTFSEEVKVREGWIEGKVFKRDAPKLPKEVRDRLK